MTSPFEDPEDVLLREWFKRHGPPSSPSNLYFDTARWTHQTAPQRLTPRPRWMWSIAASALFLGLAGGSIWMAHFRTPTSVGRTSNVKSRAMVKTVRRVETWIGARTPVPVGAPKWLPPLPSGGITLSASARVTHSSGVSGANGWVVSLYATQKPWPLNSPHLTRLKAWLQWSRQAIRPTTADAMTRLQQKNPLIGIQGLQVIVPPQTRVWLGHGISGVIEKGGTVIWHKGTLMGIVVGVNASKDVALARIAVTFLARHTLPSGPMLVALAGNRSQAQYSKTWGAVDWIKGRTLTVINGKTHSPTTLLHVATSWSPDH